HLRIARRRIAHRWKETDAMLPEDFAKLREDVEAALLDGANTLAILGHTPTALRLVESLDGSGLIDHICGVYTADPESRPILRAPIYPLAELANTPVDLVAVASDDDKQELLLAALPYLKGTPKVVVAGYGHLAFRDPVYQQELAGLLVPSLANGY